MTDRPTYRDLAEQFTTYEDLAAREPGITYADLPGVVIPSERTPADDSAEAAVARVRELCATAKAAGTSAAGMGPGYLGCLTVGEVLAALDGDDGDA